MFRLNTAEYKFYLKSGVIILQFIIIIISNIFCFQDYHKKKHIIKLNSRLSKNWIDILTLAPPDYVLVHFKLADHNLRSEQSIGVKNEDK